MAQYPTDAIYYIQLPRYHQNPKDGRLADDYLEEEFKKEQTEERRQMQNHVHPPCFWSDESKGGFIFGCFLRDLGLAQGFDILRIEFNDDCGCAWCREADPWSEDQDQASQ